MKNFKYIALIIISVVVFSCRNDRYKTYDGPAYVQFGPSYDLVYEYRFDAYLKDTVKLYSFYYEDEDLKQDTVYFDLYMIGNAENYDRPLSFEQVTLDGVDNAVPNVHYKAFDNSDMAKHYMIPKGSHYVRLPIVVLRDESLKSKTVNLQFKLVANKDFKEGDKDLSWRRVVLTDMLSQPASWPPLSFLKYSVTKHSWMITVSGKKWDDEYFKELGAGELGYWTAFFKKELMKENLARESRGEEPMADEFGDPIEFL